MALRGRLIAAALGCGIVLAGCTSTQHAAAPRSSPVAASSPVATSAPAGPNSPSAAATHPATSHATTSHVPSSHAASPARLALALPTGDAQQVITVAARSATSTTAVLRAWQRDGSGWRAVGPSVPAWLGTDGLSTQPSESRTATPIGSFTLTQAFGHDADPGTALPYTHTTPADWWISQPGPLYNTRQRCAGSCPFTQGAPNEHLYYELPYYRYAVVIDYNTRNAPGGVRQGAGSAFFLHVTVGAPTQGCVSVAEDQLVRLLRWLRPAAHPRILIGVV